MAEGIEKIGKSDVVWSYVAVIFQVGAGIFLLPFILNYLSSETVAVWSVFQVVTSLVLLLDFGFRPSFARNVGYVFSGVHSLQREGISDVVADRDIDYSLLKNTIQAMRHFYRWTALAVLLLLATVGTFYFVSILQKYDGDRTDAVWAWVLLCVVNCYELYTYYYDSLLTGKGYVRQSQKIMVLSRVAYLVIAIVLVMCGVGLCAIVASQIVSIVIRRWLSYRVFFTAEMQERLRQAAANNYRDVLSAIAPNAVKVGLTYLGGFCINKSAVLLGAEFIPLEQMAAYGITFQVMDVLGRCGTVLFQAWTPKIVYARAMRDVAGLRRLFLWCIAAMCAVMVVGGGVWLLLGNQFLLLIHSQTQFIPAAMLAVFLGFQILEKNQSIAAGFIQADNRIPFFKPSLISGAFTVLFIWLALDYGQCGLWGLILVPGIVQMCYQSWKWPVTLMKELK